MRSTDRDHPGQRGETPSLLKIQKIIWAWWCVPVVPATGEAEAGELLEPERWRLQWAEIVPLHSSLEPGDRVRLCLKKKEGESEPFTWKWICENLPLPLYWREVNLFVDFIEVILHWRHDLVNYLYRNAKWNPTVNKQQYVLWVKTRKNKNLPKLDSFTEGRGKGRT